MLSGVLIRIQSSSSEVEILEVGGVFLDAEIQPQEKFQI